IHRAQEETNQDVNLTQRQTAGFGEIIEPIGVHCTVVLLIVCKTVISPGYSETPDILCSEGYTPLKFVFSLCRLASCNLGVKTCENLGSILKLESSCLKELDLSNNDLQDSGVELLSAGMKSSHCKLDTLRLSGCMVTEKGCCSLAAALSSGFSHLKELDLSLQTTQRIRTTASLFETRRSRLHSQNGIWRGKQNKTRTKEIWL
uniref:SPRY-associated domain-containing protein n=1 Tax=Astyanax mexicanus TaxID=7994 RepID=A0A3B1JDW7_ASTMX